MAKCIIHEADGLRMVEFQPPCSLSRLLASSPNAPAQPCGGRGVCGKCRVRAMGHLSERGEEERSLPPEERLACQASAVGDVELWPIREAGHAIVTEGDRPRVWVDEDIKGYSAAVDVGTTTVAAYLYGESGQIVGVASAPNPQGVFGADVLSRIDRALAGEGKALQDAICRCIAGLFSQAADRAGVLTDAIRYAVITGNTAMLYLLTGRSPASIAQMPFRADCLFDEWVSPAWFGLNRDAKVYLCPSVSAYVGADITCAMLAGGFTRTEEPWGGTRLLADIGTNGEMALLHQGQVYCCSTAAGPAFEGAGIEMGMNARDGAIRGAVLRGDQMELSVIGDVATGLCGSGIVDVLACLIEAGVVDESGRMARQGHPFASAMTEYKGQVAFRCPGTQVVFTQKDVRAVQLAKAAICAGMRTLLYRANITEEEMPLLLIAGGFGSCIRPESAEKIGLIPKGFAARARQIGNAAGAGAGMVLLNREERESVRVLSRRCQVIELSTDPFFMEEYVNAMAFDAED